MGAERRAGVALGLAHWTLHEWKIRWFESERVQAQLVEMIDEVIRREIDREP